jgi:large repetitive protein
MPTTRIRTLASVILTAGLLFSVSAHAATTLSFGPTPISWNVVGLDSNSPTSGPRFFPLGARVCSSVATTNVSVTHAWDSTNAFINLRAGSLSTIVLPSIGAGQCVDAFFEVDVNQTAAAFDTTRRFHITATDLSGTITTPTPRELYVEHLISQNRNSITDVKYGPVGCGAGNTCTSVAPGGSMNLVVGNSYDIQLLGGTATQGYNQFEEFINFPNTIFQVTAVTTSYSADNSPYVPNPNDKLYADACLWANDPNDPAYRSCVGGDFKAGGNNVVTTYTIKIVSGGGTSQTLSSLLYDFSGSSYHYNADFGVGARIANVIDPTAAGISKSFSPNPTNLNGISALKITLTNPNAAPVGGYNFVDNLPANLVVATPPAATTSGCGTPTLTAVAGSSSITFTNGTLEAGSPGTCVISVNVTPTTTGNKVNTTNNLFIGTADTGHNAAATLGVNSAPPPGTGLCGQTLANWSVPNGTVANPPDLAGGLPTVKAANVATATLAAFVPADTSIDASTGHVDSTSWKTFGYKTHGQHLDFTIDTSQYTAVQMSFWMANIGAANGPNLVTVTHDSGAGFGAPDFTISNPASTFTNYTHSFTGLTNTGGNTVFRITATGAANDNSGAALNFDDMVFTGCTSAVKATITKTFVPNPIAVGAVSTLTFTLTNTNTTALTGATFTDSLPSGVQVAATPAASTTCTGGPTWAPGAAATTLTFGSPTGGTIPASGSCTVSVNVTATTAGPHTNTSGFLATTEGGTNTSSVASAPLTAVLPPSIAKAFAPSPILAGGISRLTFTITNPNPNDAISGVAFADTLPTSPGAMKVAGTPNPSATGCGAPVFAPVANAGSVTFSGGTIAAGGTCTVAFDITAPVTGTYNNTTSGNVSHIINAQTVNGNTASASLVVNPPHPSIGLLKQVASSATGPWESFLAIASGSVFYQFTIENTGDVPLTLPAATITDNTLNVSTCNATLSGTVLPVAVAANDNNIVRCVVGPFPVTSGSHTNTAHATGMFSGSPVNSTNSSATYATTSLTLVKSVTETTFTSAGNLLHYSYLVTNNGFASLPGPVTVADNKATVTCPAVNTVGDLDDFFDPGESITCTATYTITGTDVSNAAVTNTASASAGGATSPTASKTVPLSTSADVSLVKTLDTAGPFNSGQTISYTIVVANAGPATATSIQVTDTPSNLTITTVSGSGCAALPCTIASLASGTNTTINVTATINAPGVFDNSATATATQPDPDPSNNTDNTGNGGSTGASADVSLVKTLVTSGPFVIGESISYTLFVANAGPSTATSIQVTDTPTNLNITNVSGGGCAALPCTIASMASGANTTINVTATITAVGAFDNSANATAAEFDPNTANNTDSTGNGGTAVASADVSLVKTLVTVGPFTAGESISYTIVVANAGPSTATNIQVTDTPTNLSITTVSGSGCAALPCTIASLASGANTTINVTATITAAGAFDNIATATATESDPNPANNTDSTGNGGNAAASADISVVKTLVTTGPFTAGESINYTIVVANAGPSTATSIQVTDTPTNLLITNVTGSGCSALPCTLASLAVGATTTINVTATIIAAGAFDNTGNATAAQSDPSPPNNTDSTGNGGTAAPAADVSIVKTLVTAGPFTATQTISYTLLVANAGPSTATNIQVTDTPSNLAITNVTGSGCSALPCTIASLASGANTTINVTATITVEGAFDNTATATPAEFDPNTANNTDSTGNGGTAAPAADVSLVKTLVTTGPFAAGQSISYTLVIANAGPSTATSIQVTDTPTNLVITTVSGSGCSSLPCTIASLASGANTTINVSSTIVAAGAFDNSATATPAEFDPNTSNNTDNTGNGGSAAPSADVSLVKTLVTAGPFNMGQSVSYTLVIANAGPSTATNIQVTDTPTHLTITNVSGSGCSALPCTIASLAAGFNTTINVTTTINATGVFDNSATATAAESDPNQGNNTDNTGNSGSTGPSADVSLVKTLVTAGPFTQGQSISYTLVIANAGPSTATSIQVTDTPTNLTITTVSGSGCSALPCTIASLASGANTTINVTATINASGVFDNTATATATEFDPNTANNTDSTGNGGSTGPSADVSLVKTLVTSGPFTAGQTISYTLVVANAGTSTATSIQVTDTPTNLTILTVSGSGCSALPCTIASLAVGANTTINVTARIIAAGAFDNTATATPAEFDPNTSNNTDNTGNGGTANPSADVSIVKNLLTSSPWYAGQTVSYTLLVSNAGPSMATNIVVTDTPTNQTITNVSGSGCSALPCTIPSLAVGANTTINVSARITAAGTFTNTANATPAEFDPNTLDNTSSAGNGGLALASADVSLVKTLVTTGPFTPGQTISYTLVVANAGPSMATGIQVTDTPTNLTITNVSGSGCSALPCTIPSLPVGANTTINVTATINAVGAFDNSATATPAEFDPNTSNNTDNTGNGGNAAPLVPAGGPTLSTLGLIIMGMLLAVAGALVMRVSE